MALVILLFVLANGAYLSSIPIDQLKKTDTLALVCIPTSSHGMKDTDSIRTSDENSMDFQEHCSMHGSYHFPVSEH
jgi:hypothetical protein